MMDPIKQSEKQKASKFLNIKTDIANINKIKSLVQKSLEQNRKYETKDSELKTEAALLKKMIFNFSSDVIKECQPSSSYSGVRNHMRILLLLVIQRQLQLFKQKSQVWEYVQKLELSISYKQNRIKYFESLKTQFDQLAQDIQKQTSIQNITLSSKLENIGFAGLWEKLQQRQSSKIMRKESNGSKINEMEATNATLELQIKTLKCELNQLKQEKFRNDQKELTEQQIRQTLFWKHKQAQMVQLKQQIIKNQNQLHQLKQNNFNLTNTIAILSNQIQQAKQKAKQKANIKQPILNWKSDESYQKQNDKTNQIIGQKLKHLKAKVLQLSTSLKTDKNTIKSLFKEFSGFLKQETKNTFDQISVFSSNQIQQKPKRQIASNSIPFNIYSRQLFFWDNLFLGFASNSEEKPTQNFLAERDYLVNALEEYTQKRILRTKLLFEQNRLSNSNVHTHIDGKSNYVIVMKLLNGYFIAAYSQDPLIEGMLNNGGGFIGSLTNKQRMEVNSQLKGRKTTCYDRYQIIFGNDYLTFITGNDTRQVQIQKDIGQTYYKPKLNNMVLFGEDSERVGYERYEVHRVIFDEQEA